MVQTLKQRRRRKLKVPGSDLGAVLADFDYNTTLSTFSAGMAKRPPPGAFAAAPLLQGKLDGSGTPDVLSFVRGSQISGHYYDNFDGYQGGGFCVWTPEQDTNARTGDAYIWYVSSGYYLKYDYTNDRYEFGIGGQTKTIVATLVGGAKEILAWAFDTNDDLDATNYAYFSRNNTQTFGMTSQPTAAAPSATIYIGSNGTASPSNGIIEGFVFVREIPWNGSYGTNLGQGDIVEDHYASASGADVALSIGSWGTTLSVPTNSTAEQMATGEGEAWSHPHSSALLTDTFGQTAYGASAWADEGSPIVPVSVQFNGTTTSINCGSDGDIDNIHDAEFTAEAWIRADGWGENNEGRIFDKAGGSPQGWRFQLARSYGLQASVNCATTNALSRSGLDEFTADGKWHHVVMYFNDAGDRKVYLAYDGVWVSSYVNQDAGIGAIVSDAANDFLIGNVPAGTRTFDGAIGWAAISKNDRYGVGVNFVPPSRMSPPADDANYLAIWKMDEGSGTAIDNIGNQGGGGSGAANRDGTLSNGSWNALADMDVDAPGERVFNWGYSMGSDGANDGIRQEITSQAVGRNYVLRVPVTYDDVNAQVSIVAYDNTNGAAISTFLGPKLTGADDSGTANDATMTDADANLPQSLIGGTIYNITDGSSATITAIDGAGAVVTGTLSGGTEDDWDNGDVWMIAPPAGWVWCEPFCFELPTTARNGAGSDCTALIIKCLNVAGDGVLHWHQVELLDNLIDNPSLETWSGANPDIPDGWTNSNLDAGDLENSAGGGAVIHSGVDAAQFNAGASAAEEILAVASSATGDFVAFGIWLYGDGGGSPILWIRANQFVLQASLSSGGTLEITDAAWTTGYRVARNIGGDDKIYIRGTASGPVYADDIYGVALDAVSLTVTPASEANSVESSGIRIDGHDDAPATITSGLLKATQGRIRFKFIPRHDIADWRSFGYLTIYICSAWGDGNNLIQVRASGATNRVTLVLATTAGGVKTTDWDAAGVFVAGTTYTMEIRYTPSKMELFVDEVLRITINEPVIFATVPTIFYPGTYLTAFPVDAVFAAP